MSLPNFEDMFKGLDFSIVKFSPSEKAKCHIIDPKTIKPCCTNFRSKPIGEAVFQDDYIDITTYENICLSCKDALEDKTREIIMDKKNEQYEREYTHITVDIKKELLPFLKQVHERNGHHHVDEAITKFLYAWKNGKIDIDKI